MPQMKQILGFYIYAIMQHKRMHARIFFFLQKPDIKNIYI